MPGIDLATASAKLTYWLGVEERIGLGQSVSHEAKSMTRADLGEVAKRIDFWDRKVKQLSRGSGISSQRIVLHG